MAGRSERVKSIINSSSIAIFLGSSVDTRNEKIEFDEQCAHLDTDSFKSLPDDFVVLPMNRLGRCDRRRGVRLAGNLIYRCTARRRGSSSVLFDLAGHVRF